MRHAYQLASRYGPTPAAVVDIILAWNGRQRTVPALVDTGASGTVIRLEDYTSLRLLKIGDEEEIGGVGDARGVPTVVDLTFEGLDLPSFPVLAMTDPNFQVILIGRDVLNRILLECNGPQLEFEATQP